MRSAMPFAGLLACAACAAAAADAPAEASWTRRAAANVYLPEGDDAFLQPTIAADRGTLHLEARYNYEDRDTLSAWAGWNLSVDGEAALEFTPMLGAVAGDTSGVAAGFELALSWRRIALYSESEYLHDLDDGDGSFFYTWTELSLSPAGRWRAGLVAQRSRVVRSDRDVQRGLLLGATVGPVDLTAYVLDPDGSATWVLAVAGTF